MIQRSVLNGGLTHSGISRMRVFEKIFEEPRESLFSEIRGWKTWAKLAWLLLAG